MLAGAHVLRPEFSAAINTVPITLRVRILHLSMYKSCDNLTVHLDYPHIS